MKNFWSRVEDVLWSTRVQIYSSYVFFFGSILAWPISALTWAKDEPPTILGLSFLALIISGYTTIVAAQANARANKVERKKE